MVIHGDTDRISADHCLVDPDCQADLRSAPIGREGRAALHNLDTRGRSQR